MRRRSVLAVAIAALAATGCGGSSGHSTSSQSDASLRQSPSSLSASDLSRAADFWFAQSREGRLVLARVCKAQAARAAQQTASSETEDTADDPIAGIEAGYDAANTIYAIDANVLAAKIARTLKADPHQSIGDACQKLVKSSTARTTVTLHGVRREVALGAEAYLAKPTMAVHLRGEIRPVGDGAEFDLERRTSSGWDYVDTVRADPDGGFAVTLRAYRAKSNLYRLKVRGAGAAVTSTVEIYFDRPRRASEPSAQTGTQPTPRSSGSGKLTFTGNGGKRIGSIRVPWDATLRWTNSGSSFSVLDDQGGIFVNSDAHSGDSAVDAGTYTGVEVNAIGDWTITIARK